MEGALDSSMALDCHSVFIYNSADVDRALPGSTSGIHGIEPWCLTHGFVHLCVCCACTCACLVMSWHVKAQVCTGLDARGGPQLLTSLLKSHFSLGLEFTAQLLSLPACSLSPYSTSQGWGCRPPPHPHSFHVGLRGSTTSTRLLRALWGSELWSLRLCSKYF